MNQHHLLSFSGELLHASAPTSQQPAASRFAPVVMYVPLSPYVEAFQNIETPAIKIAYRGVNGNDLVVGPPLGNVGKGCDRSPLPLLSWWCRVNDSASSHVPQDVCNSSTDCLGGHHWSAGGRRVSPVAKNTVQGIYMPHFHTCAVLPLCCCTRIGTRMGTSLQV